MRRLIPALATPLVIALPLLLASCFNQDTKADIIRKSESATTVEDLRTTLGEPDELNKAGPIEEWIYDASDGTVRFPVIAGKVGPVITGAKRK